MAENEERTDEQEHLFANDGTDWTTPPSPVDPEEKAAADKAVADKAREGDGPGATNEPR
jgi:hypothetical protein